MKRILYYFCMTAFLIQIFTSCSENTEENIAINDESTELNDESISTSTTRLSTAIDEIMGDSGYDLLTLSESETSSISLSSTTDEDSSIISISLDDIQGEYEYSPEIKDSIRYRNGYKYVYQYFSKTNDSEYFTIKLPEEKATSLKNLYSVSDADTALSNNFVITTNQFDYADYEGYKTYSYVLNSEIDIDDEYAAGIYVNKDYNGYNDISYLSTYDFSNDYTLSVSYERADTMSYSYSLYTSEDTLYQEAVSYDASSGLSGIASSYTYSLQIGDIKIERTTADESDSIIYNVYVNDILQEDATVSIITTTVGEGRRFCHKELDVLITLEDGTEYYLSELMGDTQDELNTLFESMEDVYFAKYIINKLAWRIYQEQ